MNQELSRVQTYGSRRNGRKGKEEDRPKPKPVRSRASRPMPELVDVAAAPEVAVTMEEDTPASEYRTRTEMFPSRRIRVSKWFLNFLSTLFVLITAALLWWGIKGAPPISEMLW
ncbi:hypothetical protein ACT3XG_14260 [Paenibacillus polymyxa]|uniref:Uncharacterized protein n=1 Tax=Paenibacillus polymyxa (strain SC2) TaxID=886882 RepID=E3E800_PAEPS|nr:MULTISPECIES: hypothetical protein [Paenibacillus]ADO57113.1 hypothetical protein PPSC2_14760 [Paenibacillus polymyxa SC2]KAF6658798.1 hypothetical protein HFD99_00855 [Paenibacillus sp. EKM301P]MDU8671747.1 hypothetical protein [Paenibacillus polymyxa]MDU8696656.1 hypothetical protein [Paenibacillus polymyxa]RPE02545.1 hypothetical protein EG487_15815 [Paenibacillus polymyxa]